MSRSVSDQLRQVIERSGLSSFELGRRTGVHFAAIRRFLRGERGLTTDTLDKLSEELKLQVTSGRKADTK